MIQALYQALQISGQRPWEVYLRIHPNKDTEAQS